MDHDQYRAGVLELYLGEVIGEGGASRAVVRFAEREAQGDPDSDDELLPLLLFPIARHGQRESTRLQTEQTKELT